jgi:cytoskeletal protein CcmA (bactofilin family)
MNLRRKPSDEVSGFLDKGTNVTGELEFAGTLRIDGDFHGSITTNDTLIIGEHAMVHADIKAGEIEIHGQILGSIVCKRRITIWPTGRIRGDVETPTIIMSDGATIDGRIKMTTEKSEKVEETTILTTAEYSEESSREENF